MKRTRILILLFFTLVSSVLLADVSHAQKFLTKPVEFVCHAAAGGGSDLMARMVQNVIEREKLASQPIAVVNRAGGAGAIAMAYVAGKKGDPHFWLTATTGFLQTPLQGLSKYNYKNFTPLANLAYDDFLIIVRADSPYKSMKDLVEAARKKPGDLKVGGTYAPGVDAIVAYLIGKETGTRLNYIPFKSGSEVMIAVLGGHVDMASANPGEALAQVEAKKVRGLGATTEKRIAQAPDIPTLKEQGINVVFQQFRSIAAPQDIPKEAVGFYEELFRKVADSRIWKEKYIQENLITWDYKNSPETLKLWESENAKFARIMKDMGIIK